MVFDKGQSTLYWLKWLLEMSCQYKKKVIRSRSEIKSDFFLPLLVGACIHTVELHSILFYLDSACLKSKMAEVYVYVCAGKVIDKGVVYHAQ